MKPQFSTAGQRIPATGIYLVKHSGHKLAQEFVFLKGERFPHCSRCKEIVFELLHAAPYAFSDPDFCVSTSEELSAEDDDGIPRKVV